MIASYDTLWAEAGGCTTRHRTAARDRAPSTTPDVLLPSVDILAVCRSSMVWDFSKYKELVDRQSTADPESGSARHRFYGCGPRSSKSSAVHTTRGATISTIGHHRALLSTWKHLPPPPRPETDHLRGWHRHR